jgi:hypothetical protein
VAEDSDHHRRCELHPGAAGQVWIGDDLLSSQLGPIAEQEVELMPSDTGDTPLTPAWPPFRDQSQILYSRFSDT